MPCSKQETVRRVTRFSVTGGLSCPRVHGLRDLMEIVGRNGQEPEPEARSPVAVAPGQIKLVEQRSDGRGPRIQIGDVAPKWMKPAAHVDLIDMVVRDCADAGERLQAVAPAECFGWRVADDAIARLHAPQRPGFAVASLNKPARASVLHVLRGRDDNPMPVHDMAAANTRSPCPSGSSATKVRPKSMVVGACAMASPRLRQLACCSSTASGPGTVKQISLPPPAPAGFGATVSRDHSPSMTPDCMTNIAKVGEDS